MSSCTLRPELASGPICVTSLSRINVKTNASKVRRTFKVSICLGNYEMAKKVAEKVYTIIENDLLPHADQPGVEGDREEKIGELLDKQNWSHLTEEDHQNLFTLITKHHEAFILEKGELGKIQGPPVHINLANPNPLRGPNYRYPEKAKAIIADLLKDMEEHDVIEASTAAWLSPIVLVSKSDGSLSLSFFFFNVLARVHW